MIVWSFDMQKPQASDLQQGHTADGSNDLYIIPVVAVKLH